VDNIKREGGGNEDKKQEDARGNKRLGKGEGRDTAVGGGHTRHLRDTPGQKGGHGV